VLSLKLQRSQFYSFKTYVALGEIDHVKTYKEDYKNKAIRNRLANSLVVRKKEAPLLS